MKRSFSFLLMVTMLSGAACHRPEAGRLPGESVDAVAGLSPVVSAADLRAEVGFLASDRCEGRLTGSPGVARAAQYIATVFTEAGLQPWGSDGSYYQPFEFAAGVRQVPGKNRMEVLVSSDERAGASCELDTDFCPLTYSGNGSAEGEVIFVGYGLVEPGAEGKGYDSYAGLDVSGKIVLALRDLPEDVSPERRQELALYAGDRYKAKLAADRGAKAFLMVMGPNSPHPGTLVRFRESDRTASVPIIALSVSSGLADRLLAPAGKDLKSLQTDLDGGELGHSQKVTGQQVRVNVELERVFNHCRNVIGVLPPLGDVDEYVLVGAHYDHIGTGEGLGSLAKEDERGDIHNGADDNASGTSVVLEMAESIAASRAKVDPETPQRGVIFAAWSGEELGLVGSSHYVNNPPVPLDKTVAYFNFDMVGRLRDDKLIVQGVGSSPAWPGMIERHNAQAGFSLNLNNDPYLPTDSTVFYTSSVPGLTFFTDLHADYNRPTDDADTLNYDGMERIARFAEQLVLEAARPDSRIAYAKVEGAAPSGGRGGMRAYTGIVPDFAAGQIEGVKLADVRADGPAAQAGLKAGDLIVEFGGKKIASLRDYADALIGAKIDEPVTVVVMRGDERISLTITPTVRSR